LVAVVLDQLHNLLEEQMVMILYLELLHQQAVVVAVL
jgi:hypothetical protein